MPILKGSDNGVLYLGLLGVWTLSSDVLKNTAFWKLDLFPLSGKMLGARTVLGLLESANLSH
jgi:hypothetical protein